MIGMLHAMASLTVRVMPRSGRTEVVKGPSGEVVVRVRAAPERGRATTEAAAALAALVGVPPSAVTLRAGARSRVKVFAVDGVSAADLERALDPL